MDAGQFFDAGQLLSTFVVLGRSGDAEMRLVGEMDVASVARLDGLVDRLLADGRRSLTVDLSRVTFMDAAGLGALVRLQKRTRLAGGVAEFLLGETQPTRLLRITGMDRVLTFVPGQARRTVSPVAQADQRHG